MKKFNFSAVIAFVLLLSFAWAPIAISQQASIRVRTYKFSNFSSTAAIPTASSGEWNAGSTTAGIFSKDTAGIVRKVVTTGTTALTSATTITLDSTTANTFTLTPASDITINATTVGLAGQEIDLLILTSGTTSRTLTFGTNFVSAGTLATGTTDAKRFVISFVSNGNVYIEKSRTAAL